MRKAAVAYAAMIVSAPLFSPTSALAEGTGVDVWLTEADESKKLQQSSGATFVPDEQNDVLPLTIDVNEEILHQEMDGFGAAITGSSAHLINTMEGEARDDLLDDLFGEANFHFVRITMGASDFNLSRFTYNDLPPGETDPQLDHFSIEQDEDVIRVLQDARAITDDLKVIASPWSAPAWMKTPETLDGGELNRDYYSVYAQYFVEFIRAYQEKGIPIYAVTVQNEPHHESTGAGDEYGYPSMRMDAADQIEFVKNHLGPAFEREGIDTKIIGWDHNWNEADYPLELLDDPGAKQYLAGSAFHCYAGEPQSQTMVHDAHPDKGIWFTECSGGEWATDFGENLKWNMETLLFGSIRNWSKSVLLWNMALDEQSGPITPPEDEEDPRMPGGCSDCRGVVTIDSETGSVTRNVEYYILAHASQFVQPGSHRIESADFAADGIENVAFKNPDGSKVLVAMNTTDTKQPFKVRWGSESFVYELEGGTAATFKWEGDQQGEPIRSGRAKVEAESFDGSSSVFAIERSNDIGGGSFVGGIQAGDYMWFSNVEMLRDTQSIELRLASEWDSSVEVRVHSPSGPLLANVPIESTGGWFDWRSIAAPIDISEVEDTANVYLVFSGPVNVNWFQFSTEPYENLVNYIENPSFENGTTSWSEWHPSNQLSAQSVSGGEVKSGNLKLEYWSDQAYKQTTYQTLEVPNGRYHYSVWLRSSGGQETLRLEVKQYGGETLYKEIDTETSIGEWSKYSIEDVPVTSGQAEVAVHVSGRPGNWANFDDFSFKRVSD